MRKRREKVVKDMKIGIVGMGPVGSTLAVHFALAGQEVHVCDIIEEKIALIKKEGINLTFTIERSATVAGAYTSIKELIAKDLDLLVFCVKTPYLQQVINASIEVKGKVHAMAAQNGIDNEYMVAEVFGKEKTLRMVINYAGNMINQNTVKVTFFNPPNYIGTLHSASENVARTIAESLSSVELDTEYTENIRKYTWKKSILNATLSSLCAVTQTTMKDVMDFLPIYPVIEGIIEEGMAVAEAEGIKFEDGFKEHCINYLKRGGRHFPSMAVDVQNKNPTEINHLNGKIVEYGQKHGIPTPYNLTMTRLIQLVEKTRSREQ